MEFGLFQGGFVHRDMRAANPNAEHDRLVSEVALCEVGDRHNWKYAWFTEHHFLEEYSHISANEVLMPWVLARTEQLHVGSGIINVTPPVNHPARVAERVTCRAGGSSSGPVAARRPRRWVVSGSPTPRPRVTCTTR
jgi:Luciferase-like monooxygenase